MISLNTYINNTLDPFKLSKAAKQKLLVLDKLFWEIAQMYHNDKPRYATNIDNEIDKFISAYKSGIKYFPKLEFQVFN